MSKTNEQDVVIKKMVIQLGKKKIDLTMEEARKLYTALEEVFKEKVIVETVPWLYKPYPWRWDWPSPVWCGTGTSQFKFDSNTLYCSVGNSVDTTGK